MIDHRRVIRLTQDYVLPCYTKLPLAFARGKDSRLWDTAGEEYLDFFSGWAVSGIGHCHKRVVEAIQRQAEKLIHLPNSYYHENQALLAEEIIKCSFPGKVFFCNSGAEAVEAAIKLARRHGDPNRYEIITMERSFHGRTAGAMAATGQKKIRERFGPLLDGFVIVPFGDEAAVRRATTEKTIAILTELIQGEGGVRVASESFVRFLRDYADEKKLILMFDEVQTGMGRTGKLFCYEHYGVVPDVMLLAKSLGGGFPIGAMVARAPYQETLDASSHASTFGGNPLACAAALAVFEAIKKEKLAENADAMGQHLMRRLKRLQERHPVIREVRGKGLLQAIELTIPAAPVYEECLKRYLLVNATQEVVLRLAPPLTIREKEIDRAVDILDQAITAKSGEAVDAGSRFTAH